MWDSMANTSACMLARRGKIKIGLYKSGIGRKVKNNDKIMSISNMTKNL